MVVAGAGFLGTEVAAAARAMGLEVTVAEPEPVPVRRSLGDRIGAALARGPNRCARRRTGPRRLLCWETSARTTHGGRCGRGGRASSTSSPNAKWASYGCPPARAWPSSERRASSRAGRRTGRPRTSGLQRCWAWTRKGGVLLMYQPSQRGPTRSDGQPAVSTAAS
ncbi:FAD-dependent oxidoreductase [Streptomyces sp. NPDC047453]|uniref:FAD-dependent oxidoreductase n=1 Tax=Streptomyces sp. NPDC047453 TaxID=3154812 RepID=UPI0033D918F9